MIARQKNNRAAWFDNVFAFVNTQTNFVRQFFTAAAVEVVIEQNVELTGEPLPRVKPCQITLSVTYLDGNKQIAVFHLTGPFNILCYDEIITAVRVAVDSGANQIILDLSQVCSVGISAMVTVYDITAILRGREPLGLEDGWTTLRALAHSLENGNVQNNFKLVNPPLNVRHTLENSGLGVFLEPPSNSTPTAYPRWTQSAGCLALG